MKRLLAIILSIIMIISVLPVGSLGVSANAATTEFAGGSGTEADPYLIETKYHLDNVRNHLSSNFKLINDIEFTEADFLEDGDFYNYGVCWKPIGDKTNSFTGNFDGNNYKIINLKIRKKNSEYVGLFGYVYNGNVSNLHLVDVDIEGKNYVGSVCGYLHSASVRQSSSVKSAHITSCYASGSVVGYGAYAGGICGYMNGIAYHMGAPGGSSTAYADAKIQNSFNEASVSGTEYSGGIVGYASSEGCTIDSCINNGVISATKAAGGILGYSNGEKGTSYSIVGFKDELIMRYYFEYAILSNCINKGNITASKCGGIIGDAYYTTYGSTGTYNGASKSYNIGALTGDTVGGIIPCSFKGQIANCFYLDSSSNSYSTSYGTSVSGDDLKIIETFTNWDFDSVWTMDGDKNYKYPELQCFTLKGEVGISGTVAYDSTVTADLTDVEKTDSSFTYKWLVDNIEVGTGDSYRIKGEDVGKQLKVKVTSSNPMNSGTLVSAPIVVAKAQNTAVAVDSQLVILGDTYFEISIVDNQEYSIDNANWYKNPLFSGLEPNKEYTVYSRVSESELYLAGESKAVLTVTTNRRPLSGAVSISGISRYGSTLNANISNVTPQNATYTYKWMRGDAVVGTGASYTVVADDIGHSISLSLIGSGDYTGTLSSAPIVCEKALAGKANAPVTVSITNNSVTLVTVNGHEYSKDGTTWQDSPVFTGLSPATDYNFYQRIKSTDTNLTGECSNATTVTTFKNLGQTALSPTVQTKTGNSITLNEVVGYEYSKNGTTWQDSPVFLELRPCTEYTFYQRVKETATDYAGPASAPCLASTLKTHEFDNACDTNCNICGDERIVDGHKKYAYSFANATSYAFTLSDGVYSSTNKSDSSSATATITAHANGTIKIEYFTSTESNYDKLIIKHNATTKVTASGSTAWTSVSIAVAAGDKIYVTYSKDYSQSSGSDTVGFKIDSTSCLMSADNEDATCEDAVICDICKATVKAALGHDYSGVCDTSCNTCGKTRVATAHTYNNECDTTCNVCGYVRTVDGHKVGLYSFTNATNYPFSLSGGTYSSTNTSHNSSATATLTAGRSGSIKIDYYTSTESGYDKLIIKLNSTTKVTESGTTSWKSITIPVVKGDKIYITYSKDGSVSNGYDKVYFKLDPASGFSLAENLNPTCEDAVICDICGVTVKQALGHSYNGECDTSCNTCGKTRTAAAHTYDNACDSSCNICGATRTPSAHVYSNACDSSCNVCGATRTPDVHRIKIYTFENSTSYPFVLNNGVYSSTNKSNNSAATVTLTANRNGTIKIEYYTSTETTYDKLIIKHNSTTKVTKSGSTSWASTTFSVVAGDKIYITYSKDSSQSSGTDTVYFKIDDSSSSIAASTVNPTCEDAVICDICGETVKEALGHTYSGDCDTSCNVCEKTRTAVDHTFDNACDTVCNVCEFEREITHDYQESFDENNHYDKCTVCGDVINSQPHVYDNNCDAYCNECENQRTPDVHKVGFYTFTNATNYPFSLADGVYSSTNKANNSSATATITIHRSGTIKIDYRTSTESSYDYLTIKLNSTTKVSKSGNTSWASTTIPVVKGDKIYITYSKDGSQSSGTDSVYFKLDPVPGFSLAEDLEPTCEDAVICDICGETVKEALGHSYSGVCDTSCNVCDKIRTAPDHTFDNACDAECNVCATTRVPSDHVYDNACDATCNVCGYERTPDVHKIGLFTLENDNNFPFVLNDGVYTSANKINNSSSTATLDIQNSGSVIIDYLTSTEKGYDKLVIKHNETVVVTAYGDSTEWKSVTIDAMAGDKIYIAYTKDEDGLGGNDEIYFKLSPTPGISLADDLEPTCETAVVCDVCGVIVKEALGHIYSGVCDTSCNTCGDTRTADDHTFNNACDIECNVCGYAREITHDYQPTFNQNNHFDKCTVCGYVINKESHKLYNACNPTCECGYTTGVFHDYKPTFDKNNHFDKCTVCDDMINSQAHEFDNACDTTCDCGYVREITHDHQPVFDENNHFDKCTVCGNVINTVAHEFDNACDTTCDCGYVREITHDHKATFDANNHFDKCTVCGDVINTKAHKFDNTCDTTCDCGYVREIKHNHKATFDANNHFDKCTVCGDVINTKAHKFDNACDTACDCGYTRKTEHKFDNACDTACNVCGVTRKTSHKFGDYVYNNNATEENDGTKTRTCSVCGHKDTITADGTKLEKTLIDSSKTFKDVPKSKWYKKYVDYSVTYGIFSGTSKTVFSPNQDMSRAQFVQVFANISGVDTTNRKVSSGFSDVPSGKWFTSAVAWAAKNDIVNGVGKGKFAPNDKVTREQMCVMIVNYIENYQKKTLKSVSNASTFADDKNIAKWSKTAVYKCAKAGLVNGVGANKFDPKASATRAQGATLFTNFYKEYMK